MQLSPGIYHKVKCVDTFSPDMHIQQLSDIEIACQIANKKAKKGVKIICYYEDIRCGLQLMGLKINCSDCPFRKS